MKYSDLGHAFHRNMKIMLIHECKKSGSLVVRWQLIEKAYLNRNLEKPFWDIHVIVKLHLFFLNSRVFLYFTSSRGKLYIFHLYFAGYLVAFIFIISSVPSLFSCQR